VSYGEIFLMVLSFVLFFIALLVMGEQAKMRHVVMTTFWLLVACAALSFGLDLAGV
jgi:hypothetical protein